MLSKVLQISLFMVRTIMVIGIIYFSFSLNEIGILFFPDRYFTIIIAFFGLFFSLSFSSRRAIYIWIILLTCLSIGWFILSKNLTKIAFFTPILVGENVEVMKDGFCYKNWPCFPTLSEAYCKYDYYHQLNFSNDAQIVPFPDSDCIFTGNAVWKDKMILKINKGDTLSVINVFIWVDDFSNYTGLQFDNGINYKYSEEYFKVNVPVFNDFIRYINSYL